MLVGPLEGKLREANTSLVTSRAAQHSLNLGKIETLGDNVRNISTEVQNDAEAAVAESVFRRQAMVIAVAIIIVIIVALYFLKRELDRRLE